MQKHATLNESLHRNELLKNGDLFLKFGKPCHKIGKLKKGVMRGFVCDNSGAEITTHFYQEGDMVVGSFMPNVNISMTIQALSDCEISVADYSAVMAQARRYPGQERQVVEYFQNNPQAVDQLRAPLFEDKVVDFVLQICKVEEQKVDVEELMRDPDDDDGENAESDSAKD